MAIAYRITKTKYATDHSGQGAALYGGRWNSKSIAMLYASEYISLATLEVLANASNIQMKESFSLITYDIPDSLILHLDKSTLPASWKDYPLSSATREIGDSFIEDGKYMAMKVPSALITLEHNYLIHAGHKEIKRLKILVTTTFQFDERLV